MRDFFAKKVNLNFRILSLCEMRLNRKSGPGCLRHYLILLKKGFKEVQYAFTELQGGQGKMVSISLPTLHLKKALRISVSKVNRLLV